MRLIHPVQSHWITFSLNPSPSCALLKADEKVKSSPAAIAKEFAAGPQKRQKVVVRVPGTTANMGPGFDSLGMAVDIWNEISVERSDKFSIEQTGIDRQVTPYMFFPLV